MRKQTLLFIFAILSLAFFSSAQADQVSTTGNQFTLISQGARESAMGGDFSAFADGAFGVFGNPAATASLKGGDISLSQIFWFADTNYETVAIDQTIDRFGTLGAGLSLYWVPAFDNTGGVESAFSSSSYQGVVSYATPLGVLGIEGFSLGLSGRYVGNNFGSFQQVNDLAFDLGAYYQTDWKPLRLGFVLKDIGLSSSNGESIPFSYGLGAALGEDIWLLTAEALETSGQDTQFQTGGEIWVAKILAFRAGFRSQTTSGSYFGPSAGVGLKLGSDLRFDYAVASYGDLGLVQWIALGLGWDSAEKKEKPAPTPVATIETPAPTPVPAAIPTPTAVPGPADFILRGQVDQNNVVQLNWDPQAGAVGYNIYVSLVPGAGFKKVTDRPITDTHWSEQTGLHGITFYYRAKVVNSMGEETLVSEVRPVEVP